MPVEDLYALLEIEPSASAEQIRHAHRRLVLRRHRAGVLALEGKLARMHRAFEVLSDPERRREYDARRKREGLRRDGPADAVEQIERARREGAQRDRYAKQMAAESRSRGRRAVAASAPFVGALTREMERAERAQARRVRQRRTLRRIADVVLWLTLLGLVAWLVVRLGCSPPWEASRRGLVRPNR